VPADADLSRGLPVRALATTGAGVSGALAPVRSGRSAVAD